MKTVGGSSHTFVKFLRPDGSVEASGFILAGDSLMFQLPKGTYRLRSASGQTWHGEALLFGPSGAYSESETLAIANPRDFWTVQLELRPYGNFDQSAISFENF